MKFIWKVFAVLFNYISVYEINNIFSSYLFLFAFFFFFPENTVKGVLTLPYKLQDGI